MSYFRTVIIQDFAILFTKYPQCPIFKFPPFNSPCFRDVAVQSSAHIFRVEQQVKLSLANLPIADTFCGAVSSFSFEQKRERNLLIRQRHPVLPPPPVSINRGAIYPSLTMALWVPSLLNPAMLLSVMHSTHSTFNAVNNLLLHSPLDFCPVAPVPAQIPHELDFASVLPLSNTQIIVGGMALTVTQLAAWDKITARFDDTRLRMHQWEWLTAGKNQNLYLPYYTFQTPSKLTDIWDEWASGRNRFLAVRDLEENWGTRWCRNNQGLKIEMTQRKKVITLVEKLAAKLNWNVALALRFLREVYKGRDKIYD
ncbi:hypothetical protein C8R44DRAFT_868782 [Mycena epipterygia]|nr:hypothetical protein C8R44DRAFT_868782 [Mycena epipterygia]